MSSALKTTPTQTIRDLMKAPDVIAALNFFESSAQAITDEHIRICSIPASPFGEQQRAEFLRTKFVELGLTEVNIDSEGNCLGLLEGTSREPLVVVSAHLDTVFSSDTDFTVRRNGKRLLAPGLSDDGCGLAALLAFSQAMRTSRIEIEGSLRFVGTVGEEGEGNLRG